MEKEPSRQGKEKGLVPVGQYFKLRAMPLVRVFLVTYRRPVMLRRALRSLLAQTLTDWVCELHNDDPADDGPARLLREFPDPRIVLHQHGANWGPVMSFNHAFKAGSEPFAALLEDDNWWEPAFLETMTAALRDHPAVELAWSNLRVWQEEEDGSWTDTGRLVWPAAPSGGTRIFHWPAPLQATDALHSNGSMVYRGGANGRRVLVPAATPLAIIEPVRERAFRAPLLFVTTPLANFALTQATARDRDRAGWARSQMLVAASFFRRVEVSPAAARQMWRRRRSSHPRTTGLLFMLTLAGAFPLSFLRHASPGDWLHFIANTARHPRTQLRVLRFRSAYPTVWQHLVEHTESRRAERRPEERRALEPDDLWDKDGVAAD